jgi:hypothetical protein
MGAGVRGRSPLLGEGIRGSVRLGRLGRLGIGMISKSSKKDGTLIVHQCQNFNFNNINYSLPFSIYNLKDQVLNKVII